MCELSNLFVMDEVWIPPIQWLPVSNTLLFSQARFCRTAMAASLEENLTRCSRTPPAWEPWAKWVSMFLPWWTWRISSSGRRRASHSPPLWMHLCGTFLCGSSDVISSNLHKPAPWCPKRLTLPNLMIVKRAKSSCSLCVTCKRCGNAKDRWRQRKQNKFPSPADGPVLECSQLVEASFQSTQKIWQSVTLS